MLKTFLPCLWAFLACLTFCFVFELRRWRFILAASFTGAMGWLVYLLPDNWGSVARFLTATVVVAVLSEIFARILKTPATIFLIIGIIPMVPGGGIYYTLEALINGDMPLFVQRGMETAASAGAIAVGCSLVSSVARIIALLRRERENRQNRNTI
ncbi:threonine/serine exporter family protein [Dysosmobacter sp. HCP28S3_G4]|uniref:threonine/serine exporter family protein n=1 Tax=Dysosmobacter sp. HCP28S3_G4 TaxID=3438938 RepID=UPI003F8B914C